MNRKLIVALDSFKKQIKSPSFWAMVFVPILVMLVPTGINYYLNKADSESKLEGGLDKVAIVTDENVRPYFKGLGEDYRLVPKKEAENDLKEEKIDSYGEIFEENGQVKLTIKSKTIDTNIISNLPQFANEIQNQVNIENAGLNQNQVEIFSTRADVRIDQVDKEKSLMAYASYFILLMFMYFMLIMYSNILVVDIATEKGSKMIEFIFSSVSSKDYFAGKILGNFLAIILHSVLYLILGLGSYFFVKSRGLLDMVNINMSLDRETLLIIGEIFLFIILSLLSYMIVAATLGSLANKQEDASKVASPLMVTIIAAFMVAMIFMKRPANLFVKVASFIPYISVFFMPLRLIKADAGIMEAFISLIILLLSLYISYIISSKIYKKHILNYQESKFLKARRKKN